MIVSKNAKDIFCGSCHSFYIDKNNKVYSWGLNNHGQLGQGHRDEVTAPKQITSLDPYEGDYFVQIDGGEHHSAARSLFGCVMVWGANDESQIGVGNIYGEWREKEKIRRAEEAKKEEEDRLEQERLDKEAAEKAA